MPIVLSTPRFRPRDLLVFPGYRQSSIAWLQYGTATGAVYFVVGPLFAGMLPDTGWGLGVTSAALFVRGLLGIITGPLTGWLVARIGIRPVVLTGGLLTAGFTALTGLVQNPFQFIIVFGVALSAADAFMAYVPAATVVQRWFLARRGVMMGVVSSGAGFGGFVFAPLMAVLVAAFGWRSALFALGAIILVLALPAVRLNNGPRDVGAWVDGVEGRTIPDVGEIDELGTPQSSVRQILGGRLFWGVFFIFGVESWALGVYSAYQVIYLDTIGVGALASSGALGLSAGVAAIAGIVLGRLSDRLSPYFVLVGATAIMFVASILFLFTRNEPMLYLFSVLLGIGYGVTTATIPVAVSRYFGARNFSRALGLGVVVASVMGGLGPFVTGLISESTGSFTIPIQLVAGLLALSVVAALLSRPPAYALASIVSAHCSDGGTPHAAPEPRPLAAAGTSDDGSAAP